MAEPRALKQPARAMGRQRAKEWLRDAEKSVKRALIEIEKSGGTDVAIHIYAAKDELDYALKNLGRR